MAAEFYFVRVATQFAGGVKNRTEGDKGELVSGLGGDD